MKIIISENQFLKLNEELSDKDKRFFLRRIEKYEAMIDYKMRESLNSYCHGKRTRREIQKNKYVEWIRGYIYEMIERYDVENVNFNPYFEDHSDNTKKFENIYNVYFKPKIERFFKENCKLYLSPS